MIFYILKTKNQMAICALADFIDNFTVIIRLWYGIQYSFFIIHFFKIKLKCSIMSWYQLQKWQFLDYELFDVQKLCNSSNIRNCAMVSNEQLNIIIHCNIWLIIILLSLMELIITIPRKLLKV